MIPFVFSAPRGVWAENNRAGEGGGSPAPQGCLQMPQGGLGKSSACKDFSLGVWDGLSWKISLELTCTLMECPIRLHFCGMDPLLGQARGSPHRGKLQCLAVFWVLASALFKSRQNRFYPFSFCSLWILSGCIYFYFLFKYAVQPDIASFFCYFRFLICHL